MGDLRTGLRVQVRGRWQAGDGYVTRLTPKCIWVRLDGEDKPRLFSRVSVRPITFVGKRLPWEESATW